jgi:hypothetical protein
VKITTNDIIKNGIWLTFPPLLFSLSLMSLIPTALTPAQFNRGIPDLLLNVESIGRILVFAMPAFFSIGISTKTQKRGLALYSVGVTLYYLSYGTQNFSPDSNVLLFYLKLLRPWQLRWGATDDEVNCAMSGDDIVQKPNFV